MTISFRPAERFCFAPLQQKSCFHLWTESDRVFYLHWRVLSLLFKREYRGKDPGRNTFLWHLLCLTSQLYHEEDFSPSPSLPGGHLVRSMEKTLWHRYSLCSRLLYSLTHVTVSNWVKNNRLNSSPAHVVSKVSLACPLSVLGSYLPLEASVCPLISSKLFVLWSQLSLAFKKS